MDISRFRDPEYETMLRDFYRQKYAGKRIDLMVGVMAPSLDFLLKHGEAISPGTPIVFCGIDRRELADRDLPANMTGVLVKREIQTDARDGPASIPTPARSSSSPAQARSTNTGRTRPGVSSANLRAA